MLMKRLPVHRPLHPPFCIRNARKANSQYRMHVEGVRDFSVCVVLRRRSRWFPGDRNGQRDAAASAETTEPPEREAEWRTARAVFVNDDAATCILRVSDRCLQKEKGFNEPKCLPPKCLCHMNGMAAVKVDWICGVGE